MAKLLPAILGSLAAATLAFAPATAGASAPEAGKAIQLEGTSIAPIWNDLIVPTPMPPGIGIRITDEGPVFTDANGRTLYLRGEGDKCEASWPAPEADLHPLLKVYAKYPAPTCLQQWPAALASAESQPVGDWDVKVRPSGERQWTYKGRPVHYSYKDELPGDVNGVGSDPFAQLGRGGVAVALPPLRIPPGVQLASKPGIGIVLTTATGVLYTRTDDPVRARANRGLQKVSFGQPGDRWKPVVAGQAARGLGPWSVVDVGGTHVWAFNGQTVYNSGRDYERDDALAYGTPGARVIVLQRAVKAPAGFTVTRTPIGPVYAEALTGRTLYSFNCNLPVAGREGRFSRDNWNDDVAQREQFCAAPDRCGEMWTPVQAPSSTMPRGGVWSVATIPDPVRYPLRWVPAGGAADAQPGAIKVWTHGGRALFTHHLDKEPGDFWGEYIHQNTGQRWHAVMAGARDGR